MSSLTFGPKWVRDLSSGDTGAAAPPNTPPPRKYKLAEFRYGREEMLALVSEEYEMPLGLKEFEDIINEKPIQPLAFIALSEEEERCQMGGVNSLLVLKMTGRGGPGIRGRGGMRGRGRGRGDFSLHRSTSEEPYNQRNSWSDSSRGGFHRPVGRGDSLEGGGTGRGYEMRQRLSSEGSFSKQSGEYWRTNSREPQTPGSEDDGWSLTSSNKPWTGKKGLADNNKNWRTGKDPEEKAHEGLQRSKSWTRPANHDKDDGGLPEWCMDNSTEDNVPGSFDASGQFRAFKDAKEDDGLEEKDIEDKNELDDSAFSDEQELSEESTDKKKPKSDENDKSELVEKPDTYHDTQTLKSTASEMPELSSKDNNNSESSIDIEAAILNSNRTLEETNIKKEYDEDTLETSSSVQDSSNTIINSQHAVRQLKAPVNLLKNNDEDFEFSIDHITSMVANLGDESDEEELSRHESLSQQKSQLSVTHSSSQQNIDPSILFVQKSEPGKNVNGLQDWIYRDPQGEIQGPFTNDEMNEWLTAGYFTMGLLVRRVCDEVFLPLGDVFTLWGRVPFTSKSQPPPVTNQMLMQHLQSQQQQQQQQQHQQQQQQHIRQALLMQAQQDRPQDLSIPKDISVWGDNSSNSTPSSTAQSPWTQEKNAWKSQKSPQNVLSLQQIEDEQRLRAQIENEKLRLEREKEGRKKNETQMNMLANDTAVVQKKDEADFKQREKEELQRKALEALKQRQQIQQQQKMVEQQRLIEGQNRREEEIRKKQQLQRQQMQQMMYQKHLQQQQRRQQPQSPSMSSATPWTHTPSSSNAPSLAEIQRAQERKEAELQEHMKVIHQQELLQQQQKAQQRWNQQLSYSMQQQRGNVKSITEIQAEEAKKTFQLEQMKQQQYRQQQQQKQNYNSMAWNAAGQPINSGKSNKVNDVNDTNSNFWDDVMGISSSSKGMNGPNQRGHPKKGFNDFPPMQTAETKSNKRDTRDQEILNRIFQQPAANSDFVDWVDRNLPAVKNLMDVPTVAAFLQDVESPRDINDYMAQILGESPEKNLFVREFLERRNKSKKR